MCVLLAYFLATSCSKSGSVDTRDVLLVVDRIARTYSVSTTLVAVKKTAEPIEMPFGAWGTHVGPRNLRDYGSVSLYYRTLVASHTVRRSYRRAALMTGSTRNCLWHLLTYALDIMATQLLPIFGSCLEIQWIWISSRCIQIHIFMDISVP